MSLFSQYFIILDVSFVSFVTHVLHAFLRAWFQWYFFQLDYVITFEALIINDMSTRTYVGIMIERLFLLTDTFVIIYLELYDKNEVLSNFDVQRNVYDKYWKTNRLKHGKPCDMSVWAWL